MALATIVALKNLKIRMSKLSAQAGWPPKGGMAKAKDAGVLIFIPKPYTAATMLNTHEVLNGNGKTIDGFARRPDNQVALI